jgi:hypothetical protein
MERFNKTDNHDIAELLLKVAWFMVLSATFNNISAISWYYGLKMALNTTTLTPNLNIVQLSPEILYLYLMH